MASFSYQKRCSELKIYFDRTALPAWTALTSDVPLSRIRQSVRLGREQMRANLLSWLPHNLEGVKLLDAGCGTGMLAIEAARRGADVIGIDISPNLIELAKQRSLNSLNPGKVEFICMDMAGKLSDTFDHVIAMDSLIHYNAHDMTTVISQLLRHTRRSLLFTYAPSTFALRIMHTGGKLFPKKDRSPAIVPTRQRKLHNLLEENLSTLGWQFGRTQRASSVFYKSHALELVKQ
jgi:magnesium-protoporphyrin O-methyltransferase